MKTPSLSFHAIAGKLLTMLFATGVFLMTNTAHAESSRVLSHHVFGKGADKVIVIHSWIDDATSFDAVKPYLDTDHFSYVFADLRGYGGSRNISGTYTSEEAAGDVFQLADYLGWETFHLVGHSMSGMIVQRAALIDWSSGQRRLKSVVAITPVTADGFTADDETKSFLIDTIANQDAARQLVAGLTGERLTPRFSDIVVIHTLNTSSPEAKFGFYKMWIEEDFSNAVKSASIATPLLVISGKQDLPGFQRDHYQKTFAAWYPNVEIKTIEDAGHLPNYETPIYLASLIEQFLSRHSTAKIAH